MNLDKQPLQTDSTPKVVQLSDVIPTEQSTKTGKEITKSMKATIEEVLGDLSDI